MLNDHARAALAELDGMGARDISPDEIVALHTLGLRLDHAAEACGLRGRGLPVRVGDSTLWPPTCAGEDWWSEAQRWFSGRLLAAAYGFGLAHGRDAALLLKLYDRDAASRAVRTWFRGLGATLAELDEACGLVNGLDAASSRDGARMAMAELAAWDAGRWEALRALYPDVISPQIAADTSERMSFHWRGLCAELAAVCGGSPEEWYVRDRRETVRCYALAFDALALRAGSTPAKDTDPVVVAVRALRHEIAAIAGRRGQT